MSHPTDFVYLDTSAALAEFCSTIARLSWFCIDTEFIREKTYHPQLALIQIGTPETLACVDPLAINDLSPLHALMNNPAITKVMHAAHQDLEVFYLQNKSVPQPIFDTQVAAALLGMGEQIGYAALVQTMTGTQLDKAYSRTDWTRRPLSQEELAYAIDDVRYLRKVYPQLKKRLEEKDRLPWVTIEGEQAVQPERFNQPPEDAWKRIRGWRKLRSAQLSTLQSLAAWRENMALQNNQPRQWIIRDEPLLDIAQRRPGDKQKLSRVKGLHSRQIEQYGQTLIRLVEKAQDQLPPVSPTQQDKLTSDQLAIMDVLNAVVRTIGQQQGISPQKLATRTELEQLIREKPDCPLLSGWRAELVGSPLREILTEGRHLKIAEGQLIVLDK